MVPKMTVRDAAKYLGSTEKKLYKLLDNDNLTWHKTKTTGYFDHNTARKFFNFNFQPKTINFQIVKGGTGKTSLAHEFAVRASLYGAKVLCIDLDQQGNLTHSFRADAEPLPVMVDILAEGYSWQEAIVNIAPGIDLLSSRIENSLLDEVINLKKYSLNTVYKQPLKKLKKYYDLIIIDCPPNLGQSVSAATLAADYIVTPVIPEKFALAGLECTCQILSELQIAYKIEIPFGILLNKYDGRMKLSQEALKLLKKHNIYKNNLLNSIIRTSQDFPNAVNKYQSIFDSPKNSIAKQDIDNLTIELLAINNQGELKSSIPAANNFEEESLY